MRYAPCFQKISLILDVGAAHPCSHTESAANIILRVTFSYKRDESDSKINV